LSALAISGEIKLIISIAISPASKMMRRLVLYILINPLSVEVLFG
jgi:hypothetical protein